MTSRNNNPFDVWYMEEKGTSGDFELESDVDEVDFDEMDDVDE